MDKVPVFNPVQLAQAYQVPFFLDQDTLDTFVAALGANKSGGLTVTSVKNILGISYERGGTHRVIEYILGRERLTGIPPISLDDAARLVCSSANPNVYAIEQFSPFAEQLRLLRFRVVYDGDRPRYMTAAIKDGNLRIQDTRVAASIGRELAVEAGSPS